MLNSIHQKSIGNRRPVGKVGMLDKLSYKRNHLETGVNASPQRVASKTLTVSTFTADAEYAVTIEGRVIKYTAVAGDTNQSGVASRLAVEINGDSQVRGLVQAVAASGVITLSSLLPGFNFSASTADAKMTLVDVNTALDADAVPFGRLVFYAPDEQVLGLDDDGNVPVKLPEVSDYAAKRYTITLVGGPQNNTDYRVVLNGGEFYSLVTSDADATEDEILGGLATALQLAAGVTAIKSASYEAGSGELLVEVDSPDDSISLGAEYNLLIEDVREATDLNALVAGFATFNMSTEGGYRDGKMIGEYKPNEPMQLLTADGDIFLESSESITRGGKVYVGLAGAERGLCFASPGADRLDVSDMMCWWRNVDGDIALLRMH